MADDGPPATSHRNLAIRLIRAPTGTASASTFLLDEWPIFNFVFEVHIFYHRSGKFSLFPLLRPNPLPNLRTTSEAMFTQNSFQMVLDQTRSVHIGHRFIYEHLFTRDQYRNGPEPVHFWNNVRKSAVCTNKLKDDRVEDDRRRLNPSLERSQRPLAG